MRNLADHWEEFALRLANARRVCVLTDLDGTLIPLEDLPEQAQLTSPGRRVLEALHESGRVTVGVVSGRRLRDLVRQVGLKGIWYVGNHGYEMRTPGGEEHRFFEPEDVQILDQVRDELEKETASIAGVLLEHKGPIVTLHYRRVDGALVPDVERAFLKVVERHHRRVMVARGISVLEARLRSSCNKGAAVRHIRKELPMGTLVVYFGDDVTDRDAFRELRQVGISVEVGGGDSALADYTADGPAAVVEILKKIDDELKKRKSTKKVGRRAKRR